MKINKDRMWNGEMVKDYRYDKCDDTKKNCL